MAKKPIEHKSHKQVIEESYNRLNSKQKTMLRAIITAAMITGDRKVVLFADNVCMMFDIADAETLYNEFNVMYPLQMIDDYYIAGDGTYCFKWYDSVLWDKKRKTLTITVNACVFQFMRLHYDEMKKGLILETISD